METNILIIDDTQDNLDDYEKFVKDKIPNSKVYSCLNPKIAKKIYSQHPEINVVLTDMHMNNGDSEAGYKLLKSIVRDQINVSKAKSRIAPIIVVTAYENEDIKKKCLKLGCFDFMEKPINPREIDDFDDLLAGVIKRAVQVSASSRNWLVPTEKMILENWAELDKTQFNTKSKGDILEDLAQDLFATIQGWEKIEKNVRTSSDEIDLMIVNNSEDVFWKKHGGNIIIGECKNQKKPIEAEAFRNFAGKMEVRRKDACKLGFFISTSGYTSGFIKSAKNYPLEKGIIVWLDKKDLWDFILKADRSMYLRNIVEERNFIKK